MQRRSIEDYIREMERMRARAVTAAVNEEAKPQPERSKYAEMSEDAAEPIDEIVYLPEEDDDKEEQAEELAEEKADQKGEDIGLGRLIVTVTSGGGLFPVENASVIISSTDSKGGDEIAAVKTDRSGKTPVLYLPAPDKDMSQQPQTNGKSEATRAQYDITVSAPGYVTEVVEGVSVFDDVTAIQKIDMLTVSAADGNTEPRRINEETIYQL